MYYLNQLMYPIVPYDHNMGAGGAAVGKANVAKAACGPCSLCMVVNNLTFARLTLEECMRTSYELKANLNPGTDMSIIGPVIAERYGLTYSNSYDIQDALDCLKVGGMVIANPGGDRDGKVGLFTHGGHYIVLVSEEDGELTVLDPSLSDTKFHEEGREGRVRVNWPFVYCSVDIMKEECVRPHPSYHMFKRKR